ncbi:S-layer homology domain-containing protein [Rothia mucilaginosa]|uniref:S-layer homology domain-containing protein n=1 Tax=Rothia mucilaginosa TaxID=43675 RepID=UPI0028E98F20|nr:S-layer homology domain-containing protein [Rothia mucilaginosa]
MSTLPNSQSSFLRAAQGCGALVLAGAMVLPMTPALAQDAAPVANAPAANAVTPKPAAQDAAAQPTYSTDYDGILYTGEGGTVKVKGAGFTKEWREQHGTVVFYIAAEENHVHGVEPIKDLLRLEEGKDFTIADDGTFEATMTIEARALTTYYNTLESHQLTELTNVRYETGILAEPKGQPASTIEDIWARKNVIVHHPMYTRAYHPEVMAPKLKYDALKDTTKDQELLVQGEGFVGEELPGREGVMYVIREKGTATPVLALSDMKSYYEGPDGVTRLEGGTLYRTIKIPANTLDPSKQYVIEVWSDYDYDLTKKDRPLITPIVGLAPEHRGVLMARQDLKFEGVPDFTDATVPKGEYKSLISKLTYQEQQQRATRGELTAALYAQAGSPKVNLPAVSPWPDVKTTDPNYAAYVWARQKGITFGWSDGKFHADAGISNATVAAFTYRAAGSPAVSGVSSFTDVNPSSAFYREILWSTQQYVINPDFGAFNATDLVNRGQLEQMLFNFQNRAK